VKPFRYFRRITWLSVALAAGCSALVLAAASASESRSTTGSEIFFAVLQATPRVGSEFTGVVAYPNDPSQLTIVKTSCRATVARQPIAGIIRRYGWAHRGGSVGAVSCGFRPPRRFAGKLLTLESGCGQDCPAGGFQVAYRSGGATYRAIFTTAAWRLRR
jgi:hypothetical protein